MPALRSIYKKAHPQLYRTYIYNIYSIYKDVEKTYTKFRTEAFLVKKTAVTITTIAQQHLNHYLHTNSLVSKPMTST